MASRKKTNKIITKVPAPPESMSYEAKDHWKEIVPVLVADKVLCEIDLPLVRMACDFHAIYTETEDFKIKKDAMASYMKIMTTFGATYKARESMHLDNKAKPGNDDDPFKESF